MGVGWGWFGSECDGTSTMFFAEVDFETDSLPICNSSSFPLVAPPSNYANTTLLPTSSLPLSTSSSSSATSSATSSSSSASNSKSLGIGLGVGLGSALLLTLLAVFYYLRHRRRRAYALTATQDEPPKGDGKRKSGFTALDPTTPPPVPATIETEENPSTYRTLISKGVAPHKRLGTDRRALVARRFPSYYSSTSSSSTATAVSTYVSS